MDTSRRTVHFPREHVELTVIIPYTRITPACQRSATRDELLARIEAGGKIVVADAPAGANGDTDIRARLGAKGMPMSVLTPGKGLHVLAAGDRPPLHAGQQLIGLTERS